MTIISRCLKAGMRPELVDAAFRRKPPNRKSENSNYDESFLIDNLKSLEKDDISDFLMVRDSGLSLISSECSLQDISCSNQSVGTDQINNLHTSSVYYLDQSGAQAELLDTNYLSPSSSVCSDSLYSDYSANSLSPDYSEMAGSSYTININLTDIENQVRPLDWVKTQEYPLAVERPEKLYLPVNGAFHQSINRVVGGYIFWSFRKFPVH